MKFVFMEISFWKLLGIFRH